VINRGIAGDITFGVLGRLDEVIARKPAKLFIKIGINDISKNIPDEIIVENILTMVRKSEDEFTSFAGFRAKHITYQRCR